MWPHDDDDDQGWEDLDLEDDEDDDEVTERVEAAFRAERARIRASSDVRALREMQADYETQLDAGELPGVAGMRARDLLELIDERVEALDAARRARVERAEQARREEARRAEQQAAQRARDSREAERRRREEAQRKEQERARRVADDERAAAARLANARAAEVEARVALLRSQAARAGRAPAATASAPAVQAPQSRRTTPRSPARASDTQLFAPPAAPVSAVSRPTATTQPVTGADLARLRADRHISQRELAALMGVGHGMVAKAELVPTKALGDGMAAAFARVALPGGK